VTRSLTIVGGVYGETCIEPAWDAVFGSAGRAAHAVETLVTGQVELVTYVAAEAATTVDDLAKRCGATLKSHPAKQFVSFSYLHPLATPAIYPPPALIEPAAAIRVKGDVVLRYGMMEGDAIIEADVAVYPTSNRSTSAEIRRSARRLPWRSLGVRRTRRTQLDGSSSHRFRPRIQSADRTRGRADDHSRAARRVWRA
jgi:hypothetical protein